MRSGARSRLAAIIHALVLTLIMLLAAPLVAHIPLAALAGVLMATAIRMVEVGSLEVRARRSRSDAAVMAVTAATTLVFDPGRRRAAWARGGWRVGPRAIARSVRLDRVPLDDGHPEIEQHELLAEHIVAYRLEGPLFFAAAHRFLLEFSEVADVRVFILRMSRVSTIDFSGAVVLRDAIQRLERRGIVVYLSGLLPAHDQALRAVGVLSRLEAAGRVFPDTRHAIDAARYVLHVAGVPITAPATSQS